MNILIIEDEIKAGKAFKSLIEENITAAQVLDILPSVSSVIKWLSEHPMPDLIFSDIQLSDGLSFDIYKNVEILCPVIFCTAYDQYAIEAFKANSIDYLLKPIDEESLILAVEKLSKIKSFYGQEKERQKKALQRMEMQMAVQHKSTILVYFQDKIIPVKVSDIMFFYATGGINRAYTFSGKLYHVNQTLDELESELSTFDFFKTNRQFIIRRDCILSVHQHFGRRLFLKMSCDVPENIVISKTRVSDFLRWLSF